MKTIHFDLQTGCSGDMFLGALIDLGADFDRLARGVAALGLPGVELERHLVVKGGITATRVRVLVDGQAPDAAPAGGDAPPHRPLTDPHRDAPPPAHRSQPHHHHHGHHHDHDPHPDHHHHHPHPPSGSHVHRTFADIRALLTAAPLPRAVTERAVAIFAHLAQAEGRIHGRPAEEVAFHEVGAVDSIVDITGVALALDSLGVERFSCSPVNVGSGTVRCAHGVLPVPAPATAELLLGFPVYAAHFDGELTTPTGAAILRALVAEPGRMPAGVLQRVGYGAGTRDLPGGANVLRALLLTEPTHPDPTPAEVTVVTCDLDDMNPELIGELVESLRDAGALDVTLQPVQMKKNRPGTRLTLLCPIGQESEFTGRLLAASTTFGVRYSRWHRRVLERRPITLDTAFGPTRVKAGLEGGRLIKIRPEYEECRHLAERAGIPLAQAYAEVERAIAAAWPEVADTPVAAATDCPPPVPTRGREST